MDSPARVLARFLISAMVAAWGLGASLALADQVQIVAPLAGHLSIPTVSLKEARFAATLRQRYDFSCGSAAVATLLTYNYGWKVDEASVFESMYAHGDQNRIRREGFSMLDMKNYLDNQGFAARGVEANLDQLAEAKVPAIVLIKENGYAHFVVIKGVRPGEVLVGDPALGTRVISRSNFERVWINRILLVAGARMEQARFNQPEDWRARPKAPLRTALDTATTMSMLVQRSLVDF
jgi:predicted double-glycine peptidase